MHTVSLHITTNQQKNTTQIIYPMSRQQCDQESKLEPSVGIKKISVNCNFDHVMEILICHSLKNSEMTRRKMGTIESVSDFCI